MAKRPWHAGDYQRRAAVVVELANLTPLTTCWRCGLRLDQHTPHRNGRPPTWTAGHVVDGQVGGHLAPEASTCNYSAGATHGNRMRVQAVARQW